MKILMINKFLYPNGGSETYIFNLGEELIRQGNEVQYFGMEHKGRCVGNRVDAYTKDMDFHGGSIWAKVKYPIETIYSKEARRKIRLVLDDFEPDVCHINNFNYQLTPSILLEIEAWRKKNNKNCKIVFTAHDYQLVCPNHMCNIPSSHTNCEQCFNNNFGNCFKNKCIHNSTAKSFIGMMEAKYWNKKGTYELFDSMICCSEFVKSKLDSNPLFSKKTVAIQNFIDVKDSDLSDVSLKLPDKYVLYFGRFSQEKGISTLIDVCKKLTDVQFVFAGSGEYEDDINALPNAINLGFRTGAELEFIIKNAAFSVYPSEWYENCPFSVMESLSYGVPVVASRIGGIPELVTDGVNGKLFDYGNAEQLCSNIRFLSENENELYKLKEGAKNTVFTSTSEYTTDIVNRIYS